MTYTNEYRSQIGRAKSAAQRSKVPRRRMAPCLGDAHRAQLRRDDLRNVATNSLSLWKAFNSSPSRRPGYISTSSESDDIEHCWFQVRIVTPAFQPCIRMYIHMVFSGSESRIRNTWRNDVTPEDHCATETQSTYIMPSYEQISVLPHQHLSF